jgi:hypothetical protein
MRNLSSAGGAMSKHLFLVAEEEKRMKLAREYAETHNEEGKQGWMR